MQPGDLSAKISSTPVICSSRIGSLATSMLGRTDQPLANPSFNSDKCSQKPPFFATPIRFPLLALNVNDEEDQQLLSPGSALCVLGHRTQIHNPIQRRAAPGLCFRPQFPSLANRSDSEVECLWIDFGGCVNP